jgi:hypothetical protein
VRGSQGLGSKLAYDYARSHRVSGNDPWHDGPIGYPQIIDPVDPKLVIHHRHRIAAHLRRTGLVPHGRNAIPNEILELKSFQRARHDLALGKRPQRF